MLHLRLPWELILPLALPGGRSHLSKAFSNSGSIRVNVHGDGRKLPSFAALRPHFSTNGAAKLLARTSRPICSIAKPYFCQVKAFEAKWAAFPRVAMAVTWDDTVTLAGPQREAA